MRMEEESRDTGGRKQLLLQVRGSGAAAEAAAAGESRSCCIVDCCWGLEAATGHFMDCRWLVAVTRFVAQPMCGLGWQSL